MRNKPFKKYKRPLRKNVRPYNSWRDLRVKHNTKSQNSRKRDNIIYLWFWWPNKANYVKWSIPVNCFEMRCDWIRMGLVRMARNQFWIGERQRARAKEARVWKNSCKNCIIENRIRTKVAEQLTATAAIKTFIQRKQKLSLQFSFVYAYDIQTGYNDLMRLHALSFFLFALFQHNLRSFVYRWFFA